VESYGEPGQIEVEDEGRTVVVRLLGEHDLATESALRDELSRQINAGRAVVVSLMETEFIDSTVLNALFTAHARLSEHGRGLVLHVNTASVVRRALDVVDLCSVVPCTASLDEAVRLAAATDGGSQP
jgi:anti-anti-sigma factor